MRRAAGEPGGSALPPPRLRPSVATPSRCRRPAASRASAASIAGRAAGEGLVGPRLVVGDEVGHEAVVAERAVVGRDDVLDLVGQQARRVDLARAGRPEQERHLAAVADRLVGEHPDAGHAQAAGDEQQVPAARVDLERSPERPEQVDLVARAQPGEPVGARGR